MSYTRYTGGRGCTADPDLREKGHHPAKLRQDRHPEHLADLQELPQLLQEMEEQIDLWYSPRRDGEYRKDGHHHT